MTRKHFEAIAAIIHNTLPSDTHGDHNYGRFLQADVIADDLADYFAGVNPNFDRLKFLQACGVAD